MKIDLRRLLLFTGATFLAITFQNCSKGLEIREDDDASLFADAANCMASTADACIFEKNAVVVAGKPATESRIGGYQTTPARLNGLDTSGYLQNTDFTVTTSTTTRLTRAMSFRQYFSRSGSGAEQAMTYATADRAKIWMNARGVFPAAAGQVKFIVDSGFSGWSPGLREINLERNDSKFPAALDGGLIMHLYAQANIWFASGGASASGLDANASTCNDARGLPAPRNCCSDQSGCGAAIISGAADAFVSFNYPKNPAIGEGWRNDVAGLTACGLVRNPSKQSDLTASAAASACSERGSYAQVTAMGLLYASIWWEARAKATNTTDFEKFFLRHLSQISGGDDFSSIRSKIDALDNSEFGGKYHGLIDAEFTRRGL